MLWREFNCFGSRLNPNYFYVDLVTYLIFHCLYKLPPVYSMRIPCFLSCFLCVVTLVTRGARGDLLKSNILSSDACAKIFGFFLYVRRMFSVICACCIKQEPKCIGNNMTIPQIHAMKWFFHICMALYGVVIIFICGGTNLNSTDCSL